MKRIARIGVYIVLSLTILACSSSGRQPTIQYGNISPDNLRPGDTALITVEVKDPFNIVRRVEGTVKEDRTITFKLQDNGIVPDKNAGDGIWTIQVDVPFNAPPGDFEFEVTGYNEDGEAIVVNDENGEAAPLSTTFNLVIQFPQETQE
jgi:hypothetical protein